MEFGPTRSLATDRNPVAVRIVTYTLEISSESLTIGVPVSTQENALGKHPRPADQRYQLQTRLTVYLCPLQCITVLPATSSNIVIERLQYNTICTSTAISSNLFTQNYQHVGGDLIVCLVWPHITNIDSNTYNNYNNYCKSSYRRPNAM